MRSFTFGILIFVALSFIYTDSASGQAAGRRLFAKPARLVLNGFGEPEPDREPTNSTFLTASFYPIGWSRDGKFAYYVEPADEACGCYFAEIVVQDLVTDKVVWSEKYSSDILEKPEDENLDSFWAKKQKKYSAKLNQYGIVPVDNPRLVFPSIESDGDVLTPKVAVRIKTDDDLEVIGNVTVSLESKRRGSKVVLRDVYKKGEVSGFRNAEIAGVLKSPFVDRIAIIIVEEYRGWEGPPNITGIKVSGASLKTGFKK
jgi:hypothetical protein